MFTGSDVDIDVRLYARKCYDTSELFVPYTSERLVSNAYAATIYTAVVQCGNDVVSVSRKEFKFINYENDPPSV